MEWRNAEVSYSSRITEFIAAFQSAQLRRFARPDSSERSNEREMNAATANFLPESIKTSV